MRIARRILAAVLATSLATSFAACRDLSEFSSGGDEPDAAEASTTTGTDGGTPDVAPVIDASFDAPPDAPTFRDEFSRGDSLDLGNGWTEKTADVFSLVGGAVLKAGSPTHYRDNLVTRPAEEDRADVEVSALFTLGPTHAFPQVFARAQRSTLGGEATYDAYLLFMDSPSTARLARQKGDAEEVSLQNIDLPAALASGARVKLTLRVYGDTLTVLEGLVDKVEGSGTTRIGETKISDGAAEKIVAPGTVGFTASFESVTVDDFEWKALGTR